MMRWQLRNNFTLRLTLLYVLLFGSSTLLLMAFLYWSSVDYMQRQSNAVIEEEITGLAERYEIGGLFGLMQVIRERLARQPRDLSLYLLARPDFTPLQGNLLQWPDSAANREAWLEFSLAPRSEDEPIGHRARAREFLLPGEFHLLVGRDMEPLLRAEERMRFAMAWGLSIILLLGGLGGTLVSRRVSRRVEAVNRTTRDIMSGDLSHRVPVFGTNDEFDRLSGNLNRMLDRIAALMEDVRRVSDNIAHDLRTPLGRLHQQLETLCAELLRSGVDAGAAEAALRESEQVLETFTALLRIARVEAELGRDDLEPVDLASIARDVVEYYEPLAQERQQRLRFVPTAQALVPGDRHLLFQALANIVDNAIKYTPPGGAVEIFLDRDDDGARLSVRDDGPGIPASAREQVLQRFFRLDRSRSTSGCGLGLSLVDAVARLHRARIRIDGDEGTCFTLHFKARRG